MHFLINSQGFLNDFQQITKSSNSKNHYSILSS